MRDAMRSLAIFSAMVLTTAVAVHASTFTTFDVEDRFPWWPAVMIAMIAAAFVPAVVMQPRDAAGKPDLAIGAPRWMKLAAGACFVYALVNFAIFMARNDGEGRREPDGSYTIRSKGRVVRATGEAGFHAANRLKVRGISGHWILFGGFATLAHVATIRRRSERRTPTADPPRLAPAYPPAPPLVAPARVGVVPVWGHAVLTLIATFAGFFGGFLCVMLPATFAVPRLACVAFPAGAICALFGASAGGAIARRLPARCPICGGRAYASTGELNRAVYGCRDCGATSRASDG